MKVHTDDRAAQGLDRQLAKKYPAVLIVNRGAHKLQLWKNLKLKKTYGIAVGQVGLETPAGLYNIQNKAVNPAWHVPNSAWAGDLAGKVIPGDDPSNPIKARWMGIYDGVGVHGTSDDASIGSNASHGCIRMHVPDVEELYDEVRSARRFTSLKRRTSPPPHPDHPTLNARQGESRAGGHIEV